VKYAASHKPEEVENCLKVLNETAAAAEEKAASCNRLAKRNELKIHLKKPFLLPNPGGEGVSEHTEGFDPLNVLLA
jgi:hypothetical protein